MMDVDGLKAINDYHGHMTGDKVLCAVDNLITIADQELYQCKNLGKISYAMVYLPLFLLIKPSFCN